MRNTFGYLMLSGIIGLLLSSPANSQLVPVSIQEWPVPWEKTRPRDPYVAPDGSIWFVGQTGHYAARFDVSTEQFKRFDLAPGTGPHNLIVDARGIVWYAGNKAAHIGRLDPNESADRQITQFPTPEDSAADPHTLIQADNGMIWFTSQWSNSIGRFNPANGTTDILPVSTQRARPYGIALDSKGDPWVVLLGTNKLAHVNAETLKLSEIELPRAATRPRRIGITSDDQIWYVDYAEGYLGRYSPANSQIQEWPAPATTDDPDDTKGSGPYAMAVDGQDRIWFVETFPQPNRFVGFDSNREQFISNTAIPSGGGVVRHMHYDKKTHSIWFGTDTNQLGRAVLPE